MSDVFTAPTIDDARAGNPGTPEAEAPGPGFFEAVPLGFRRARAGEDWGWNQANWEGRALADMREQANKRGFRPRLLPPADPRIPGALAAERERQVSELAGFVAAQRAKDPKFLADYAGIVDAASLRTWAIEARRRELAEVDALLANGSTAGMLTGALGAGVLDPTSYIPVGGPQKAGLSALRQILSVGAREAAANVGVSLALEPMVQMDATALGVERGPIDVLTELGLAGGLGFGIGAGAKGAEIGWNRLRAAEAGTLADREALDAFEGAVPPGQRTPDEAAAAVVVRREAEVREASPFEATPEGDDAHLRALDAALRAIVEGEPLPGDGELGRYAGRSFGGVSRETVKARIARVEASPSDDYNEASGAMGPYQFLASTWVRLYRRRFGDQGLTDAQIAAKRRDPALNDRLMNDLMGENAAALARGGHPETAGNLYLAHFAGPAGARRLLEAGPDTPVEAIMGARAVAANPFLKGKSAGEVVAWAHAKMGEQAMTGRAVLRRDAFDDDLGWLAAQGEADARAMTALTARAERAGAFALDLDPSTGAGGDQLPPPRAPEIDPQVDFTRWDADEGFDPVADPDLDRPDPGPDPELVALLPAIRAIVKGGGSIHPPKLAKVLGVEEAKAARALRLAARQDYSGLTIGKRSGKVRRTPKQGPTDLIDFLLSRGGLRDDEGHDLRGVFRNYYPGRGSLFRKNGMSLDAAGEVLTEARYLDGNVDSPWTEDDVIGLLERAQNGRVFSQEDAAEVFERETRARMAEIDERALQDIGAAAWERGIDLSADMMAAAFARLKLHGDMARAIDEAIDFDIEDAARRALADDDKPDYELFEELDREGYRGSAEGGGVAPGDDGPGPDPRDAGAGWPGGEQLGREPALEAEPFDPVGPAAERQSDSIEHDVRMALAADEGQADPEIARKAKQATQLKAASPMRSTAEQDGTMGLGLFDAADQPSFRLDEDGDEVDAAALLAALDEEAKAIEAMRQCMVPPKPKGEA